METPWGQLQSLDFESKELALEILSADKDALIEGLVVENTFEQILSPFWRRPQGEAGTSDASEGVVFLDVETAIGSSNGRRVAFVWVRTPTPGLRRYLMALSKLMTVVYVKLVAGTFVAKKVRGEDGTPTGNPVPLRQAAGEASGSHATVRDVDLRVRDANRQREAFWGHLSGIYREELWQRIVLPRIFINHGISPYFPAVWNLDRICLYKGELWALEVKHKFPFGDPSKFGINSGEVENIAQLHSAGVRCLHTILVKPEWVKNRGAMYLYNNRSLAHRVAVIAAELGNVALNLLSQRRRIAPRDTSVGGRSTVSFHTLDINSFSWIGTLAQPNDELALGLEMLMDGHAVRRTEIGDLQKLRYVAAR